ncbi:MAG: tetratricopeptide repeat protein [Anaerolineae bacterium]
MPEISLKEYFARLDNLLSEHAVDEVLLHCRQILQYYPKNVTAYRYLGRALVMSGRWEEGREALRRVLSVIPDDYQAHLSLSEANERIGRSDEAIWHLERAFEQRPNDKEIIDALRALYSLHRNINNLKIQLTSAAVARQYVRSGAFTQAVDTLRSAISRMSERLDLRLLLAQILEEHDQQEEAAELALEVLGVLPDCLEANKIMARLWLSVNRPSDAQRYVNRLEAVDPYVAVEVAQGYPPDDDTFRLDELDFVRTSQSELASSRLDWLQEISSVPAPEVQVEAASEGEDFSDWASAMLGGKPAVEPQELAPDESIPQRFASLAGEEPVAPGFTGVFGPADEVDADELSALFAAAPAEIDANDPMAWLHHAGVEIVDSGLEEPAFEDLFAADAADMPRLTEEDPMAWLRDSTGEPVVEADESPAQMFVNTGDDDDDDPFAWMGNDAGVTLDDVLSDDAGAPPQPAEQDDSFGWLQNEGLLDEALSLDGLAANDPSVWDSAAGLEEVSALDDLLEDEPVLEEAPPEEAIVPGPRRGLTAMLQEANFDWVTRAEEEVATSDDLDEWLSQFGAPEPEKPVTDHPDWLIELEQPQAGEAAFEAGTDEPEFPFAVAAAEEETTPMSDERSQVPVEPEAEDDDWMRGLLSEPGADSDDSAAPASESPDEAAMPDWMAELNPEAEPEAEADEPEVEAEAADLSWLSDESAGVAGSPAAPLSDFPWMSGGDESEEAAPEAEEAVAAEMPDWMAELNPDAEPEAEADEPVVPLEPTVEDDMSWFNDHTQPDDESEEAAPEVEEAVAAEMPDWMAELNPEAEPEAASGDAEPESEPELEPPALSDFPWMSGEEGEAEQPAAENEFPWMNADADTGTEAAEPADIPDWLSDMQPQESAQADVEMPASEEVLPWTSEAAVDAAPDWLADADAETSAEPEAASENIPKWLSEEVEPEEAEPEAAESATGDDLSWLDDEVSEPVAAGVPDWLDQVEDEDADQPSEYDEESAAEPAAEFDESEAFDEEEADEEYAFLAEDDAEFLEPSPAQNAPDWLNAMVPGLDVDYEPGEDEFLEEEPEEVLDENSARREFVWLTNLVEEEMAATERPDFAFTRPPSWLGSSAASLDDGGLDDDLPDWPSDDADADVPEWLR